MVMDIKTMNLQAKKALKNILTKCVYLPALEPLLHDAPPSILRHVVGQFSKVRIYCMYVYCKGKFLTSVNDQLIFLCQCTHQDHFYECCICLCALWYACCICGLFLGIT